MRKLRAVILAASFGVALVIVPTTTAAAAAPPGGDLADNSLAQIEALTAAKLARSADQRKLDSPVLAAAQQAKGLTVAGAPALQSAVEIDDVGRTPLQVRGTIDARLEKRVAQLGGRVRNAEPEHGVASIDLSPAGAEELAADPAVTQILSVTAGWLTSQSASGSKAEAKGQLSQGISQQLGRGRGSATITSVAESSTGFAQLATGPVASEGDAAHGAAAARAQYQVSGYGITVGVLSDGVASLQESIAAGELPADVVVLPEQAGSGDEGTAMLEIVHDMAPNATLMFATATDSAESFAANIRELRAQGADIIVDDVLYFAESPFQDGPIAQAVLDVTRNGALYLSSAGNEGNLTDGTSGNYEGDFVPSGRVIGKYSGQAHDFAPGSAVQELDPVSGASSGAPVVLHWADPLGHSGNDYDVYALDGAGNVVAFSNNTQDGNDDPMEIFSLPDNGGEPLRLAVVKFSGANRYFQLSVLRGRFAADSGLTSYATSGVTRGHSTVPAAISVAAAPAAGPLPFDLEPGDPANPAGPFPARFNGSQQSERFTSDGPRRVFYRPDGTPLTPGNITATGGQVRPKPDITAADGVSTSLADFSPFFGTSASAPHAAGIAALAWSGRPTAGPGAIKSAMMSSALDIETPGRDRDTGRGIVQTGPTLRAIHAVAQPYVVAGDPRVLNSTDGDTFLEPGETATVDIPVTNNGGRFATNVNVRLTTSAPGIRIAPASKSYGTVGAGKTVKRSFSVTAPASTPLGSRVVLTARVSFLGTFSPMTATGELQVGEPGSPAVFAYTGPPLVIPDADDAGIEVPFQVTGVGAINQVSFTIGGKVCTTAERASTVGIDHTYVGDLVGTLTGPDGTAVQLFSQIAGQAHNMCQVRLTDSADRSIQSATELDSPFTGDWQPTEPLAAFLGRPGDGTWRFTVADLTSADTGTFRAASLTVTGYASG
ncbi:MAG: S8 family serine peptidase [Nakamurella sp.]